MNDFPSLSLSEAQSYLVQSFGTDDASLEVFRSFILSFYSQHGRVFAWRETKDSYPVLLSEVMLQQTQTSRVIQKYELFLSLWPTFQALAQAPLDALLYHWKGLGYNRRALYLRSSARMTEQWGWTIPDDMQVVRSLPGVGKATAAAILAFCYHHKTVYLETNIRRVLLTCFFPDEQGVKDSVLEALLEDLVAGVADPKEWYYALMDYGVLLKALLPNANTRSAHYTKQSAFENSNRQIRGQLIHLLSDTGAKEEEHIYSILSRFAEERVHSCLKQLEKEGFVKEQDGVYRITNE